MDLPETLHGQLCLLAYQRKMHRLDLARRWPLGFALRGAMLTDLLLSGHLSDIDGTAHAANGRPPVDPLLRSVWEAVDNDRPRTWAWLVAVGAAGTVVLVEEQLRQQGWITRRRHRRLAFVTSERLEVYDETSVDDLADRVATELSAAAAGRRIDPRTSSVGLLACLAVLHALPDIGAHTWAVVAPIVGTDAAVTAVYDLMREQGHAPVGTAGGSGGGCSGCGGGCGGCGGCGG